MINKLRIRELDLIYHKLSIDTGTNLSNLIHVEHLIIQAYRGEKDDFYLWKSTNLKKYRDYRNHLYPILTSFIKEGRYSFLFTNRNIVWYIFEKGLIKSFLEYEMGYTRRHKLSKIKNELNRKKAIGNLIYSIQQKIIKTI